MQIAPGTPIPEQYLRHPEPEPNKVALKDALKHGAVIPGCSLERNEKLEIK